jgi:thiol-disulfide isomerase/thioredoxin
LAERPENQGSRRRARLGGAAVAIAVALGAAVYVTLAGEGNGVNTAVCEAAKPAAAALGPLVRGEVAAFQVAAQPDKLSDLAFTGSEGEPKTLGDFARKVALVNLWATWCAPCRAEMPALDRLQAARGGADFTVVPVSVDTGDAERPRRFLEDIGVTSLPLYTDRSTDIFITLKRQGLALGLPVTLLLDRNGCRLGHINGPAEWDSEDALQLIEAAVDATQPAPQS